jgi:uncharacterized protein YjbJ (UPF0337 family)
MITKEKKPVTKGKKELSKEEKLIWMTMRNKLKRRFVFLTDKDLKYDEGKKEVMLDAIQKRLGKTKEELEAIMAAL